MDHRPDLAEAVFRQLSEVDESGFVLSTPEALNEARLVAAVPASAEDLRLRCVLGRAFWVRAQNVPEADRAAELGAAVEMLMPCFELGFTGLYRLPDLLTQLLAEVAVPLARDVLRRAVMSSDPTSARLAAWQWVFIVEATPTHHAELLGRVANLVGAMVNQYERTGTPEFLDEAIRICRQVMDIVDDGDPAWPVCLANFGFALRLRSALTGSTDDLDEAARVAERLAGMLHEESVPPAVENPEAAGGSRIVMDLDLAGELARWPMNAEAQEDVRWYIEDYLSVPFGVYDDRGARIAAQFPEWGSRLFQALFGSETAHEAYRRARAGEGSVELVVRSTAAEPLALPWELLFDPTAGVPVALERVAITRMLTTAEYAEPLAVRGSRLRVLMVISRPRGTSDVGYHMIARHLLPLIGTSGKAVDMVILRPPTLDRLREALADAVLAGEPFQVVHFDGHGALGAGPGSAGTLIFEGPRGGAHRVSADKVAEVLAAGGVPVVVLNACESGRIGGSGVEATVATRLLQGGVSSVVAMAYKVYAAAAAEFMAVFYRRLFAGDRITDAVAAGRRRLATAKLRPSPAGRLPLEDWIVPVHYASRDVRFSELGSGRADSQPTGDVTASGAGPAEAADGAEDSDGLTAFGIFVGRDALLYILESAARLEKVVLLHGAGGTGKSELAKAFGRWWRDTHGVESPDHVIWHSFEPGVASFGLPGLINTVGQRVLGTEFAILEPSARRDAVQALLDQKRILLICDNFESVHSMPDATLATPTLDETQREELREFLAHVREHGTSSVIITSRTDEDWLGPVHRVEVGGLSPQEAGDYADLLLAPFAQGSARRAGRPFADLMRWLDGHPLCMRVILPLLQDHEPHQVLDELRDGRSTPVAVAAGAADLLHTCVAYSYCRLSTDDQEGLWALALFRGAIDAVFLAIAFCDKEQVPPQFRSRDELGWERLLNRALAVGLLSKGDKGGYRIHPALPAYVAERWAAGRPETFAQEHHDAQRIAVDGFSALGQLIMEQIHEGNAQRSVEIVERHRHNFGYLLGYALEHQLWMQAGGISQGLNAYWDLLGLSQEAAEWTKRICDATALPDGSPPDPTTPSGLVWQQQASFEANRRIERAFDLDGAERVYLDILAANQRADPTPVVLTAIATCYHQLGMVAELRVRWDEAEAWYRKSLAVKEQLPEPVHVASTYHQLGLLAQRRRRWREAEEWFTKTLASDGADSAGTATASTYHQLGRVAEEQGLWDQAEAWYQKAVAIRRRIDDRTNLAKSYYHLGIVAQERGDHERAEVWYHKALIIHEGLDNRGSIAGCYHQLAVLASLRQRLEEAEAWGQKALAIQLQLNDTIGTARSLLQFGALAGRRHRWLESLTWTVKGIALFDDFPHPAIARAPEALRLLVSVLGIGALERTWQDVTGDALPIRIRRFATAEQSSEDFEEGIPTL